MLCVNCLLPFITFGNVRSSFTKRQDMFPVILALCFILKMFLSNIVLRFRCFLVSLSVGLHKAVLSNYVFFCVNAKKKEKGGKCMQLSDVRIFICINTCDRQNGPNTV